MKAAAWIDKVKAARGWDSDYRVSKELGLGRQTVSTYRSRADATMDEETAIKVAQALGVDAAGVIIDQVAERSKSPEVSSALHKVANSLCILCKVTAAAVAVVKKSRIAAPALNCPPLLPQFPRSLVA